MTFRVKVEYETEIEAKNEKMAELNIGLVVPLDDGYVPGSLKISVLRNLPNNPSLIAQLDEENPA